MNATIHSMLRRCVGWDYSQPCIYMITVDLADRRSQALGVVVADTIGDDGTPTSAHCDLTPLGKAVEDCWEAIPRFYPQVQIIGKQVMPDHFHGILWVKEPLGCHLGQVIKGFKLGCNKRWREIVGDGIADNRTPDNRTPDNTTRGKGLFAEGFQDTILFREGQLARMVKYIRENPLRLAIKRAHPDLFTVVSDLEIRCITSPVIGSSVIGDIIADPPVADPPIASPLSLHFSAIGNRSLLERQMVQVQCSRSHFRYKRIPKPGGGLKIARDASGEAIIEHETPEYRTLRDTLLFAANHGAVLISPCISDGEKQIAREAFKQSLPLVTMQNKGFAKLQKPSGRYFEACAAGRLLMLAPAAWPYTPAEKAMTRDDATAMNRLCQWLAGDGAATINYHGITPANIDRLALAAVTR